MTIVKPILDGEKVPKGKLRDLFRVPPLVPLELTRSTLLIGARGVGKTTLLRYIAASSSATAIYLSLLDELGSVAKDAAAASYGDGIPPSLKNALCAKSECLLTLGLLRESLKYGMTAGANVRRELPPAISAPRRGAISPKWISQQVVTIRNAPIASINVDDCRGLLQRCAARLGEDLTEQGKELHVLLDRADMVQPFLAMPALNLLDQAGAYYALVATRPAPYADPDWGRNQPIAPIDHYNTTYIGIAPRTQEWRAFVRDAVSAQYAQVIASRRMPPALLDAIITYSRDSIRVALELTYATLKAPDKLWDDRLNRALDEAKSDLVRRGGAALNPWVRRFQDTVKAWRAKALSTAKKLTVQTPVVIELTSGSHQAELNHDLPPPSPVDRFIAAALSVGVASPPDGEGWYPGSRLERIEISPILVWASTDRPTALVASEPRVVQFSASKIAGPGRRKRRTGKMFVGYRFKAEESREFFASFKAAIQKHPLLGGVKVREGKLPAGTEWAHEIRERLRRSSLLAVGDVTGLRGDILFELGLARGLRRPIAPVLAKRRMLEDMPGWLRAINHGYYERPSDLTELVSSVLEHLNYRQRYQPRRFPDPVPTLVGAIGVFPWNRHLLDRVSTLARREGLDYRAVDGVSDSSFEEAMDLAAKAAFLVLPSDGTQGVDAFSHFAAGIVTAWPRIGDLSGGLRRHVVLHVQDPQVAVPDSIKHCQSVITCTQELNEGIESFTAFLTHYKDWVGSGR